MNYSPELKGCHAHSAAYYFGRWGSGAQSYMYQRGIYMQGISICMCISTELVMQY